MMKKLITVLLFACVPIAYAADKPPALPDIKDYGDAAAQRKSGQALDAASQAVRNGQVRAFPDIKPASTGVDIGKIADRYKNVIRPADENLMIFVTLGMPDKTLLNLARQAARTHAVLVLRGIQGGPTGKGNWSRAMAALKPIAETGASIIIHPDLFRAYKVVQAPTFVLTTARQGEACVSELKKECSQSLRSTGDVSLDYVLERWSEGNSPLASEAQARLSLLEGKP